MASSYRSICSPQSTLPLGSGNWDGASAVFLGTGREGIQLFSSLEEKSRRWASRWDISLMLRGEMGLTVVLDRRVERGQQVMQPISYMTTRVRVWVRVDWLLSVSYCGTMRECKLLGAVSWIQVSLPSSLQEPLNSKVRRNTYLYHQGHCYNFSFIAELVFALFFVSFRCLIINALFSPLFFVLLISLQAKKWSLTKHVCHVVYVYLRVKGKKERKGMAFEVRTHRVGRETLGEVCIIQSEQGYLIFNSQGCLYSFKHIPKTAQSHSH